MINSIALQGRITKEPQIIQGNPTYMFVSIASKRDYYINIDGTPIQNTNGYYEYHTDFVDGHIFNEMLIMYVMQQSFVGQLVLMNGVFRTINHVNNIFEITHFYCLERKDNCYRKVR